MSLTNLIDKLGGLFSRTFILGAFLPVLFFTFINGVLLYIHQTWFHRWFDEIVATKQAFEITTAGVALVVAAYMVSSVSVFMREVLEGKHFVPLWGALERNLCAVQQSMRNSLRREWERYRNSESELQRLRTVWLDSIRNSVTRRSLLSSMCTGPHSVDYTARAQEILRSLCDLAAHAEPVSLSDIAESHEAILLAIDQLSASDDQIREMTRDFNTLLDYANETWESGKTRALNDLRSRFGNQMVAPTSMGNIALSMQEYAYLSYHINLNFVWPRLESVIQTDKETSSAIQDAKAQLDFLVACTWAAAVTWIGWLIALPSLDTSLLAFAIVALGGPLLTWLFLALATTNYGVFATVILRTLDLNRFAVLEKLHFSLPKTLAEEREVWTNLESVTKLGTDPSISYTHPKSSGS